MLGPIWRRRRLIAIVVLVLVAGAVLVALSSGGQPVNSNGPPSLNGSDVPVTPGTQSQPQSRAPR